MRHVDDRFARRGSLRAERREILKPRKSIAADLRHAVRDDNALGNGSVLRIGARVGRRVILIHFAL